MFLQEEEEEKEEKELEDDEEKEEEEENEILFVNIAEDIVSEMSETKTDETRDTEETDRKFKTVAEDEEPAMSDEQTPLLVAVVNDCVESVPAEPETPASDVQSTVTEHSDMEQEKLIGVRATADQPMTMLARDQGQDMANKIGAFAFLECSAKTKEGVRDVFEAAVKATRRDNKQCVLL